MENSARKNPRDVIKSRDSWWTTVFSARAANRLVGLLSQTSVTPNQVTIASALLGFAAAACFATGKWIWLFTGAIILQLSFVLDCADGQLARLKRMTTERGAWLDITTDVLKVFAIYFGISLGAVRMEGRGLFLAYGFVAYFLSVSGMFLYYARPARLKADTAVEAEEFQRDDSFVEKVYRLVRRRAYFLSFSLPDQLLLISLCAIAGRLGFLLRALVIWGVIAMTFSILRTWYRLGAGTSSTL